MTVVSGKMLGVGTRYVSFYALNAAGRPAGNSPTVSYTGIQAEGGKALTLTVPEPRKISHSGDDRLQAVDILPPLEASSGELKIAKSMLALQALLAGTLVYTMDESEQMVHATDQQGFEPLVGMMLYQQALDAAGVAGIQGSRRWRSLLLPKCKAILAPKGSDDNASEITYRLTPFIVSAYLWGAAFTLVNEGATQGQIVERMTEGQPFIDSWLADGIATTFTFTKTALSAAKVSVYDNGVKVVAGTTITTAHCVFNVAPTVNHDINIVYEF